MYEIEMIKASIRESYRGIIRNILIFTAVFITALIIIGLTPAKAGLGETISNAATEMLVEEPIKELANIVEDLNSNGKNIISLIMWDSFEPTLHPFYSYTTKTNSSALISFIGSSLEDVTNMNNKWNDLNSVTEGPIYMFRQLANYAGATLAIGILIVSLLSFFFNGKITEIRENPVIILLKFFVAIGACYYADEIMNIFITIVFIVWQKTAIEIDITSYNIGTIFTFGDLFKNILHVSSLGFTWLLEIILDIVFAWMLIKNALRLWFECAERYVVMSILVLFFPTAMPTFINRNCSNILKAYFRMLIGQAFLLISGVVFLKVFFSLVINGVPTGSIMGYLFTFALLRTGQRLDSHLSALGLNIAQTGGSMFDAIGAAAHTALAGFSSLNRGRKNIGNLIQARGLETGNAQTYKTGAIIGASASSILKAGGATKVGNTTNYLKDMSLTGGMAKGLDSSLISSTVKDAISNPGMFTRSTLSAINTQDRNKALTEFITNGTKQKNTILENAIRSGNPEQIKKAKADAMTYSGLQGVNITNSKHNPFNGSMSVTGTYTNGNALSGIISAQKENKNSISIGNGLYFTPDNALKKATILNAEGKNAGSAFMQMGIPGTITDLQSSGISLDNIGALRHAGNNTVQVLDKNNYVMASISSDGNITKYAHYNKDSNRNSAVNLDNGGKAVNAGYPLNYTTSLKNIGYNIDETLQKNGISNASAKLSDAGIAISNIRAFSTNNINGSTQLYGKDKSYIGEFSKDGAFSKADSYANPERVKMKGHSDMVSTYIGDELKQKLAHNGIDIASVSEISYMNGNMQLKDANKQTLAEISSTGNVHINKPDSSPLPIIKELSGYNNLQDLTNAGIDINDINDFACTSNGEISFYNKDGNIVAFADAQGNVSLPNDTFQQMPEHGILSDLQKSGIDISRVDSMEKDASGNITFSDIYGNAMGSYSQIDGFTTNPDYQPLIYPDRGIVNNLYEEGINPSIIASTDVNSDGNLLFYTQDGRLMGEQTAYGEFIRNNDYTDISYIPNNNIPTFTSRIGEPELISSLEDMGINWQNVSAAYITNDGTTHLVNHDEQMIAEISPSKEINLINPGDDIYYRNYATDTLKDLGYENTIKDMEASGIDVDNIYLRYNDDYQSIQIVDNDTDFLYGYVNNETGSFEHFNSYHDDSSSQEFFSKEPQTYNDIFTSDEIINMCHLEDGGEFAISSNNDITDSDKYGVFQCSVTKSSVRDGREMQEEYQVYLHNTVVHSNTKGFPEYIGKDGNTYYLSMAKKPAPNVKE